MQIIASLWKAALAGAAAVAVVLFFGSDAGKDLGLIRWVLCIPLALLLAILSLYALYVAIAAAGTRIHLFDNGLVHLHPTKNARAIRWEDGGVGRHVKTCGPRLDRSIRLGPDIKVRHPDDGAELEVTDDSINHGTELFSTIQDNVARVRMPTMLHDIAEGRRIEFGPYVVDRHGVTAEDETVRWPDVLGFVYASTMGVGGVGVGWAAVGPVVLHRLPGCAGPGWFGVAWFCRCGAGRVVCGTRLTFRSRVGGPAASSVVDWLWLGSRASLAGDAIEEARECIGAEALSAFACGDASCDVLTGRDSAGMANFDRTIRFGPADAVWREQHNHMVEQHGSVNIAKRPGYEDIRTREVAGAEQSRTILLTVPPLCDAVDVTLAHGLWQRHRACRINRCVWKAAAYQTLVLAGRLVPQSMSPRERAAARGIDFSRASEGDALLPGGHSPGTLREVLARLESLAFDPHG
ncbi:DUF6585 family protein [Nocardia sp. NPDC049526]|uniref:DUF6585 family protein n=1 Tax=Nocardia sp. NPDC049526 TaxID=3364316 RepID=UPI00379FFADC